MGFLSNLADPLDIFGGNAAQRGFKEAAKQLNQQQQGINQPYSSSNLFGYRDAFLKAGMFGNLSFNRDPKTGAYTIDTADLFNPYATNPIYKALQELRASQIAAEESRLINQGRGGNSAALAGFFDSVHNAQTQDRLQALNYGLGTASQVLPGLFNARSESDAAQQAALAIKQQLGQNEIQRATSPSNLQRAGQMVGTFFAGMFGGPGGGSSVANMFQNYNQAGQNIGAQYGSASMANPYQLYGYGANGVPAATGGQGGVGSGLFGMI